MNKGFPTLNLQPKSPDSLLINSQHEGELMKEKWQAVHLDYDYYRARDMLNKEKHWRFARPYLDMTGDLTREEHSRLYGGYLGITTKIQQGHPTGTTPHSPLEARNKLSDSEHYLEPGLQKRQPKPEQRPIVLPENPFAYDYYAPEFEQTFGGGLYVSVDKKIRMTCTVQEVKHQLVFSEIILTEEKDGRESEKATKKIKKIYVNYDKQTDFLVGHDIGLRGKIDRYVGYNHSAFLENIEIHKIFKLGKQDQYQPFNFRLVDIKKEKTFEGGIGVLKTYGLFYKYLFIEEDEPLAQKLFESYQEGDRGPMIIFAEMSVRQNLEESRHKFIFLTDLKEKNEIMQLIIDLRKQARRQREDIFRKEVDINEKTLHIEQLNDQIDRDTLYMQELANKIDSLEELMGEERLFSTQTQTDYLNEVTRLNTSLREWTTKYDKTTNTLKLTEKELQVMETNRDFAANLLLREAGMTKHLKEEVERLKIKPVVKEEGTQTELTGQEISNAYELLKKQGLGLYYKERALQSLRELLERERGERTIEKRELETEINNLKGDIQTSLDIRREQEAQLTTLRMNDTEKGLLTYASYESGNDSRLNNIKNELETGQTPEKTGDISELRGQMTTTREGLLRLVNKLIEKSSFLERERLERNQYQEEVEVLKPKLEILDEYLKDREKETENLKKYFERNLTNLADHLAKTSEKDKKIIEEIIFDQKLKEALNITTLNQFINLKNLTLENLTELPPLPPSLEELSIRNCDLTAYNMPRNYYPQKLKLLELENVYLSNIISNVGNISPYLPDSLETLKINEVYFNSHKPVETERYRGSEYILPNLPTSLKKIEMPKVYLKKEVEYHSRTDLLPTQISNYMYKKIAKVIYLNGHFSDRNGFGNLEDLKYFNGGDGNTVKVMKLLELEARVKEIEIIDKNFIQKKIKNEKLEAEEYFYDDYFTMFIMETENLPREELELAKIERSLSTVRDLGEKWRKTFQETPLPSNHTSYIFELKKELKFENYKGFRKCLVIDRVRDKDWNVLDKIDNFELKGSNTIKILFGSDNNPTPTDLNSELITPGYDNQPDQQLRQVQRLQKIFSKIKLDYGKPTFIQINGKGDMASGGENLQALEIPHEKKLIITSRKAPAKMPESKGKIVLNLTINSRSIQQNGSYRVIVKRNDYQNQFLPMNILMIEQPQKLQDKIPENTLGEKVVLYCNDLVSESVFTGTGKLKGDYLLLGDRKT